MKQSTKIILLGLFSSIALIVSCIYFKYDTINQTIQGISNGKLMEGSNSREETVETHNPSKIVDFQAEPEEEIKTLKVSSLNYKIGKDLIIIDGEMPILEDDDRLKQTLMSRCEEVKCDKRVHFSSEQVDPKWKGLVTETIELFHHENIKEANLIVEGNDIRIYGEFPKEETLLKLNKILKPYLTIYNIKNETTIQKTPLLSPDNLKSPSSEDVMSDLNSEVSLPSLSNTPHLKVESKNDDKVIATPVKIAPKKEKDSSVKIIEEKISDILREKHVNFYKSSARLTKKGKKTLNEIVTILKKYKDIKIEVQGHTDASGKASINQHISTERAKSVKNYLGSMGLNPENIVAKGFGERRLLVKKRPNSAINRRVEIKIRRR